MTLRPMARQERGRRHGAMGGRQGAHLAHPRRPQPGRVHADLAVDGDHADAFRAV
jgi:hypothetical protein